jgi:hypothetical protein
MVTDTSEGYEQKDVESFAAWGGDSLKWVAFRSMYRFFANDQDTTTAMPILGLPWSTPAPMCRNRLRDSSTWPRFLTR